MTDDWYRNTTWTPAIREAFFSRLARARGQRDQYLAIQAITLVDTSPGAALDLAGTYFETRSNGFDDARVLDGMARALLRLDDLPAALATYRRLLAHEAAHPNVQTGARFDLPYLVAVRGLAREYPLALEVIGSADAGAAIFQVHRFKLHAAQALIAAARGHRDEARRHAQAALDEASLDGAGLPRHPGLGRVGDEHAATLDRLRSLVA
jgi:hypothetical protein